MLRMLKFLIGIAIVLAAAVVAGRFMFPLPDIANRPAETARPLATDTRLGQLATEGITAHPGLSGVSALASGKDALASRLSLIETAQHSIDAQYYIWHDDLTGGLVALDHGGQSHGITAPTIVCAATAIAQLPPRKRRAFGRVGVRSYLHLDLADQ